VIERSPALKEELKGLTGQTSVPQVFIKKQFIGGT
jgi:glutaredoxin